MTDILKISLVLLIIILLLKKKWGLGPVMAISSVILAVLYGFRPHDLLNAIIRALVDKTTIKLMLALTLIRIFENVMRKRGIMQEMMDSFKGMVRDRRIIMASMPAIIGLLPSMGGALFSAPMVEEASKGVDISPEKKAFINYLFRHPWEFVLPLYPGLVLASAITDYPLREMIIANIPYALSLIGGGIIWGLTGMRSERQGERRLSWRGLLSFIPLIFIIGMVIAFHLDLSLSIGLCVLGLFIALRYSPGEIARTLKEGFSWEILIIILGVMTFKSVMELSGAVNNISTYLSDKGIPVLPILFLLPFISGLLTGLTIGFVGSTFPIILGLEGAKGLAQISFAFAAGYTGVFLSPVHLCLVLTREYFKANISEMYDKIIKTGTLIMFIALMKYLIFR
jgi:hypothetical protein